MSTPSPKSLRFEVRAETSASPEQVIEIAGQDFSSDRPRRRRFLRRGPEDRAPDREPSRTAETGRRELRLAGRPGRG
jgi:hypothetical protein